MRLLFIANSRIPSERAMGTAIMKQCEAFASHGVEVELLVPKRQNTHTEDPFVYHGVLRNFLITYLWSLDIRALERINLRFVVQRLTFIIALWIYTARSRAEILYSREPEALGFILTNKTKIVELHHFYGLRFRGRHTLQSCRGIITITNALMEDVVQKFSVPSSKMLVAPTGIDLSQFKEPFSKKDAREQLGVQTDKHVVMYTGSLEEWKGYMTLLRASAYIEDVAQVIVVGGTPSQVHALHEQYPNVQFLGFVPHALLMQCRYAADVFVAPNSGTFPISMRHTSPLKVFEYMASGVPIVASSTTSMNEMLSPNNAVLVPPDDPMALAEGIRLVISDPSKSATIAKQAQKDVEKYDWKNRTASILRFIHELP